MTYDIKHTTVLVRDGNTAGKKDDRTRLIMT
jgi:hypothetical protein